MGLPDTINNSPVPGMAIDSATNADLQKWMVEIWAIVRHASYSLNQDFEGPNLGSGSFKTEKFAEGGTATFAIVSDSANGASGAIQWTHAATQASALLTAGTLAFGQGDIYFTCRCRVASIGAGSSYVKFGLTGGTNEIEIVYDPSVNGNSNWWLHYGSGPTTVDTGIAASSTYQVIDVIRTSGVLTVVIDGDPVATASPSPFDMDGGFATIACNADTSGTTNAYFDYFKCWARTAR